MKLQEIKARAVALAHRNDWTPPPSIQRHLDRLALRPAALDAHMARHPMGPLEPNPALRITEHKEAHRRIARARVARGRRAGNGKKRRA